MPVTNFSTPEKYQYLNGFQSYHELVHSFCQVDGKALSDMDRH